MIDPVKGQQFASLLAGIPGDPGLDAFFQSEWGKASPELQDFVRAHLAQNPGGMSQRRLEFMQRVAAPASVSEQFSPSDAEGRLRDVVSRAVRFADIASKFRATGQRLEFTQPSVGRTLARVFVTVEGKEFPVMSEEFSPLSYGEGREEVLMNQGLVWRAPGKSIERALGEQFAAAAQSAAGPTGYQTPEQVFHRTLYPYGERSATPQWEPLPSEGIIPPALATRLAMTRLKPAGVTAPNLWRGKWDPYGQYIERDPSKATAYHMASLAGTEGTVATIASGSGEIFYSGLPAGTSPKRYQVSGMQEYLMSARLQSFQAKMRHRIPDVSLTSWLTEPSSAGPYEVLSGKNYYLQNAPTYQRARVSFFGGGPEGMGVFDPRLGPFTYPVSQNFPLGSLRPEEVNILETPRRVGRGQYEIANTPQGPFVIGGSQWDYARVQHVGLSTKRGEPSLEAGYILETTGQWGMSLKQGGIKAFMGPGDPRGYTAGTSSMVVPWPKNPSATAEVWYQMLRERGQARKFGLPEFDVYTPEAQRAINEAFYNKVMLPWASSGRAMQWSPMGIDPAWAGGYQEAGIELRPHEEPKLASRGLLQGRFPTLDVDLGVQLRREWEGKRPTRVAERVMEWMFDNMPDVAQRLYDNRRKDPYYNMRMATLPGASIPDVVDMASVIESPMTYFSALGSPPEEGGTFTPEQHLAAIRATTGGRFVRTPDGKILPPVETFEYFGGGQQPGQPMQSSLRNYLSYWATVMGASGPEEDPAQMALGRIVSGMEERVSSPSFRRKLFSGFTNRGLYAPAVSHPAIAPSSAGFLGMEDIFGLAGERSRRALAASKAGLLTGMAYRHPVVAPSVGLGNVMRFYPQSVGRASLNLPFRESRVPVLPMDIAFKGIGDWDADMYQIIGVAAEYMKPDQFQKFTSFIGRMTGTDDPNIWVAGQEHYNQAKTWVEGMKKTATVEGVLAYMRKGLGIEGGIVRSPSEIRGTFLEGMWGKSQMGGAYNWMLNEVGMVVPPDVGEYFGTMTYQKALDALRYSQSLTKIAEINQTLNIVGKGGGITGRGMAVQGEKVGEGFLPMRFKDVGGSTLNWMGTFAQVAGLGLNMPELESPAMRATALGLTGMEGISTWQDVAGKLGVKSGREAQDWLATSPLGRMAMLNPAGRAVENLMAINSGAGIDLWQSGYFTPAMQELGFLGARARLYNRLISKRAVVPTRSSYDPSTGAYTPGFIESIYSGLAGGGREAMLNAVLGRTYMPLRGGEMPSFANPSLPGPRMPGSFSEDWSTSWRQSDDPRNDLRWLMVGLYEHKGITRAFPEIYRETTRRSFWNLSEYHMMLKRAFGRAGVEGTSWGPANSRALLTAFSNRFPDKFGINMDEDVLQGALDERNSSPKWWEGSSPGQSFDNPSLRGKEFPALISMGEASVLEGLRQMHPAQAWAAISQIGREPRYTPSGRSLPSFESPNEAWLRRRREMMERFGIIPEAGGPEPEAGEAPPGVGGGGPGPAPGAGAQAAYSDLPTYMRNLGEGGFVQPPWWTKFHGRYGSLDPYGTAIVRASRGERSYLEPLGGIGGEMYRDVSVAGRTALEQAFRASLGDKRVNTIGIPTDIAPALHWMSPAVRGQVIPIMSEMSQGAFQPGTSPRVISRRLGPDILSPYEEAALSGKLTAGNILSASLIGVRTSDIRGLIAKQAEVAGLGNVKMPTRVNDLLRNLYGRGRRMAGTEPGTEEWEAVSGQVEKISGLLRPQLEELLTAQTPVQSPQMPDYLQDAIGRVSDLSPNAGLPENARYAALEARGAMLKAIGGRGIGEIRSLSRRLSYLGRIAQSEGISPTRFPEFRRAQADLSAMLGAASGVKEDAPTMPDYLQSAIGEAQAGISAWGVTETDPRARFGALSSLGGTWQGETLERGRAFQKQLSYLGERARGEGINPMQYPEYRQIKAEMSSILGGASGVGRGGESAIAQTPEAAALADRAFAGLNRTLTALGTSTGDTEKVLHKIKDAFIGQYEEIQKMEDRVQRRAGGDEARAGVFRRAEMVNRQFELGQLEEGLGAVGQGEGGGFLGRLPGRLAGALRGGQLMTGFQWFYLSRMWNLFTEPALQAAYTGAENLMGAYSVGQQAGLPMGGLGQPILQSIAARTMAQYRMGQAGMATWGPMLNTMGNLGASQASSLALWGPTLGLGITGMALGGLTGNPLVASIGGAIGAAAGFTIGEAGYLSTFANDRAFRELSRYRFLNEPYQWSWNPAELFTRATMLGDRWTGDVRMAEEERRGGMISRAAGQLSYPLLQQLTPEERTLAISEGIAGIQSRQRLTEDAARQVAGWAMAERRTLTPGIEDLLSGQARVGVDRSQIMMQLAGMTGLGYQPGTLGFQVMAGQADWVTDLARAKQFQIGAQRWAPVSQFMAQRGVNPLLVAAMGQQLGPDFGRLSEAGSWQLQQALQGNPIIGSILGQDMGINQLVQRETGAWGGTRGLPMFSTTMGYGTLGPSTVLSQMGITSQNQAYASLLRGGTWALQTEGRQREADWRQANINIQQAQINLQRGVQLAQFGLEGQQIGLRRGLEDWQYGYAQRGAELQAGQFAAGQALNLRAFEVNQQYRDRGLALNMAQAAQNNAQWMAGYGLSLEGFAMNRRQRDEQLALQAAQMGAGQHTWMAGYGIDTRMLALNRGWTRQGWGWQTEDMLRGRQYQMDDRAFLDAQSERRWGWNVSDLDEQIRRSTGYERKLLVRQRDRSTIERNEELGRRDTLRGREDEDFQRQLDRFEALKKHQQDLWGLEDERRALDLTAHNDSMKRETASFDLRKRHYAEQDALQQKQFDLQLKNFDEDVAMQQRSFELQKEQYAALDQIQLDRFARETENFRAIQALEQEGRDVRRQFELDMRPIEDEGRALRHDAAVEENKWAQERLNIDKEQAGWVRDTGEAMERISRENQTRVAELEYLLTAAPEFVRRMVEEFIRQWPQGDPAIQHQGGFQGLVTKRTTMEVAEAGPEYVSVYPAYMPQSQPSPRGEGRGSGDVTVKVFLDGKEIAARVEYYQGQTLYRERRR